MKVKCLPWLPFKADGMALKYFILVRKGYENNAALLEHELHHTRQQRNHFFLLWVFKYWFNSAFRQEMELAAYKTSIDYGESRSYCAKQLAYKYRLQLTYAHAYQLLGE